MEDLPTKSVGNRSFTIGSSTPSSSSTCSPPRTNNLHQVLSATISRNITLGRSDRSDSLTKGIHVIHTSGSSVGDVGVPDSHLMHATVGSVASIFSHLLLYPLDVLRTLAQLDKKSCDLSAINKIKTLWKNDGLGAFYSGVIPVLTTCGISQFVYFYLFEMVKALKIGAMLAQSNGSSASAFESFVGSLVAGVLNMCLTEPLWKANMYCMMESKKHEVEVVIYTESEIEKVENGNNAQHEYEPNQNNQSRQNAQITPHKEEEKGDSRWFLLPDFLRNGTSPIAIKPVSPPSGGGPSPPAGDAYKKTRVPTTVNENSQDDSRVAEGTQNVFVVLYRLYKLQSIKSLWSGLSSSLYLVSNPMIQYGLYDVVKKRFEEGGKSGISPFLGFVIGSFTKTIATIVTYPLQVAQSRMRKEPGKTFRQCFGEILQYEGMIGYFKGIGPKLVQTVLNAAFMFAFYEEILKHVRNTFRKAIGK